MDCSLLNVITDFYNYYWIFCSSENMSHKLFKSEENNYLDELFNKDLCINYVPEIQNRCDVWEQAFCHYCVDTLISSDADRLRYT